MKILPRAREVDYYAGISFLLYFYTFIPTVCYVRAFIDVQWEFMDGLEGWGSSTSNEMGADVYHRGDELRMETHGANPYIDSPFMNITINYGQNLAFRYNSRGITSAFAKLELHLDPPYGDKEGELSLEERPYALLLPIQADGSWHIAYVELVDKLESLVGRNILRMRLFPAGTDPSSEYSGQSYRALSNYYTTNIQIDWIRLVRQPIIYRVTGCFGEKYATNDNFDNISYLFGAPIREKVLLGEGELDHYRTTWMRDDKNKFLFASTYNCLRSGHENITIEGINFGEGGISGKGASAQVLIDNRPCSHVIHDHDFPQERLTCITPPSSVDIDEYHHQPSLVKVKNGRMPGLVGAATKLSYASAPPTPANAKASNIASRSIDLSWTPGGEVWQHLTYTGYVIRWQTESRTSQGSWWSHSMVVGNVTSTTIRDLSPNTTYIIGISGLCEDQGNAEWWNNLDRYGRRQALENALEGRATIIQSTTLLHDVYFPNFNSNLTQNHGAEIKNAATKGPTGVYGGEGHYGLIFVGSASIANCNMSSFCCDDYDSGGGCGESSLTCLSTGPPTYPQYGVENEEEEYWEEKMKSREINFVIANLSSYSDYEIDKRLFNSLCGPSLRLTPSMERTVGASWYRRQLEVEEGFDTMFSFEISNPSYR